MEAHRLEKGLSLESPRAWFGQETLEQMLVSLSQLEGITDEFAEFARAMAEGAVDEYFTFHASHAERVHPRPAWVNSVEARFIEVFHRGRLSTGGTKPCSVRPDIAADQLDAFFLSRESVRNFSERLVSMEDIEDSIEIAASSPTVCNRQGSFVRVYPRGEKANSILRLQNGNTGFGSGASHILLVTHEISGMFSAGERHQAYVDGGLFAMTLVYALGVRHIGSCCLNWSVVTSTDSELRVEAGLHDSEVVIMMIAIGYHDRIRVASSPTFEARLR